MIFFLEIRFQILCYQTQIGEKLLFDMDVNIFTHKPFWVLHIHLYLDDGQLQVLSKLLPNILDHYPVSLGTPTLLMKDSLYLILSFSITR